MPKRKMHVGHKAGGVQAERGQYRAGFGMVGFNCVYGVLGGAGFKA